MFSLNLHRRTCFTRFLRFVGVNPARKKSLSLCSMTGLLNCFWNTMLGHGAPFTVSAHGR